MGVVDEVLAEVAGAAVAAGTRMVDHVAAQEACRRRGIAHDHFVAALVELKAADMVGLQLSPAGAVVLLAVSNTGLQHHLMATQADLGELRRRVEGAAGAAVGAGPVRLQDQLGEPALVVECLLDSLVNRRRLVYSKAPGRRFLVHRVHRDGPGSPGPPAPAPEAAARGPAAPEAAGP